jgi:hypothetical protein
MLQKDGHKLILWSVREGKLLNEAVQWCRKRGLEFYAINRDYPEEETNNSNNYSRKLKVDIWIDDRNIGGLPDWGIIYRIIKENKTYEEILNEDTAPINPKENKPKWWPF